MKILALSDIHNAFEAFAPETLPDADLCIIAGDLTDFGQREHGRFARPELERLPATLGPNAKGMLSREALRAKAWLERLTQRFPVFWIPGNHDIDIKPDTFGAIPGCTCLLNSIQSFSGRSLYGVSMSPCFDAPYLASMWDYMTADPIVEEAAFDFPPVDIVVSHCPPYECLDGGMPALDGARPRLGSPALRRYIELNAPSLVLCGHIHEARGMAYIGETLVANVACSARLLEI